MNYWTESPDNIFVAAHRGYCAKYPENTLLAFQKALEFNVDQLETDIRRTSDGELVLIHDADVKRTTNGEGIVENMTFSALRALDAGCGEKIPTLSEFWELVCNVPGLTLDLELKEYPELVGDMAYSVCDEVIKAVERHNFSDRVVLNTFSAPLQKYIAEKYPEYRRHTYYPISRLSGRIETDPFEKAFCCCMHRTLFDKINISSVREFEMMWKMGVEPWCFTDATEECVDMIIARRSPLVTCNDPENMLKILRKKGKHN